MASRQEGVIQNDVFLPVRLKVWENNPIIINRAKDNTSGIEMVSAEIQGSVGFPVFAIEDGEIVVDPNNARINLVSADRTDGGRIWSFINVNAGAGVSSGGIVKGGEEIGTVVGDDLIFFVLDEVNSPEVPAVGGGSQLLPANPILALDDLDVLPLPQDQGKLLTQAEARRLSERLTDQGPNLGTIAIVGGVVVGTGLITALAIKAFSK